MKTPKKKKKRSEVGEAVNAVAATERRANRHSVAGGSRSRGRRGGWEAKLPRLDSPMTIIKSIQHRGQTDFLLMCPHVVPRF